MSMSRRQWMMVAAAGGASMALTACGGSDGPAVETRDVVQIALADPQFSILVEAVVAADLVNTLKGPGPFTVFAPTNAAFAALLAELGVTKEALLANKPLLTAVLTYHVLPGKVERAGVPLGKAVTTVQGGIFKVDATGVMSRRQPLTCPTPWNAWPPSWKRAVSSAPPSACRSPSRRCRSACGRWRRRWARC
jgi:uncharacterized surface protein with fasciclin (FAS1) repeats